MGVPQEPGRSRRFHSGAQGARMVGGGEDNPKSPATDSLEVLALP